MADDFDTDDVDEGYSGDQTLDQYTRWLQKKIRQLSKEKKQLQSAGVESKSITSAIFEASKQITGLHKEPERTTIDNAALWVYKRVYQYYEAAGTARKVAIPDSAYNDDIKLAARALSCNLVSAVQVSGGNVVFMFGDNNTLTYKKNYAIILSLPGILTALQAIEDDYKNRLVEMKKVMDRLELLVAPIATFSGA